MFACDNRQDLPRGFLKSEFEAKPNIVALKVNTLV